MFHVPPNVLRFGNYPEHWQMTAADVELCYALLAQRDGVTGDPGTLTTDGKGTADAESAESDDAAGESDPPTE